MLEDVVDRRSLSIVMVFCCIEEAQPSLCVKASRPAVLAASKTL